MNARAHYVLNQLEFTPKSTMRFKNWIIRLQSPQHITEVKAYITILLKEGKSFGLTESKLASIIEQIRTHFKSSRRNGVLLYFNDKILDIAKARIDPHDSENSHYIKLKGDQRVSIDCIEHIECLGGFEWEFFENLENNI